MFASACTSCAHCYVVCVHISAKSTSCGKLYYSYTLYLFNKLSIALYNNNMLLCDIYPYRETVLTIVSDPNYGHKSLQLCSHEKHQKSVSTPMRMLIINMPGEAYLMSVKFGILISIIFFSRRTEIAEWVLNARVLERHRSHGRYRNVAIYPPEECLPLTMYRLALCTCNRRKEGGEGRERK